MNAPTLSPLVTDARLVEVIGTGAKTLALDLSDTQLDGLVTFVRLLERWNGTYNLTAIRDPLLMATHHILDCLSVVPSMRRYRGSGSQRILDVGSGAGLPGLVIALSEPAAEVVCIDSVGKKAAFIAQAATTLGLKNTRSVNGRVETMQDPDGFSLITSRAFSSLTALVTSSRHLLKSGGAWLAMKGKLPADELHSVPADVAFHVEQLIVPGLDADRCIVWGELRFEIEVGTGSPSNREPVP